MLLVEDTPSDVILITEAFKQAGFWPELEVIDNGEDALERLAPAGRLHEPPDLVLLDINLPRIGGLDVLEGMKQSLEGRLVPVVVLTTSGADQDIDAAYRRHANAYVRKSPNYSELVETVRRMFAFWFETAELPRY